MKLSLSLATLTLCACTAFGQDVSALLANTAVDMDAKIGAKDDSTKEWSYKVSAGYDVRSGNSESKAYNTHLEAFKDTDDTNFRALLDGAYAEQEEEYDDGTKHDERTVGNVKGEINYKMLFGKNLIFADASALHDGEANVRYRIMESVGIGRFLIQEDELKFSVQTGLAYLQEDLGESDNYLGLRFAERADWKPTFAEGVSFYEKAEILWNLDETDRYLANAEAGIDIPMFADFSVTLKFVYNYDSDPAEDASSADRQYLTQLSYHF